MNIMKGLICGLVVLVCMAAGQALALGPVDGEVGAVWWENDYVSSGASSDFDSGAGAPGFKAELWIKKAFGFRANRHSSDVEALTAEKSDFTSIDFMWRPFSPSENNFVAIGVGWQESDLATAGLASDTSGARINIEGRVAVAGVVYFYGQGSYLPEMGDTQSVSAGETFSDLSGHEYEVGASFNFLPVVGFKVGYREQNIDFTRAPLAGVAVEGNSESTGFLAGLTVHF
jgi:hypothetical protein